MQISSRFTIALHILACIDAFGRDKKVTSEFLADSVNVNPVIIRRLLLQLKAAGLVEVHRGTGGAEIARPTEELTLLDVYRAVDPVEDGQLFHFHERPNPDCPVGRSIHRVLDPRLVQIQAAMEEEMRSISLDDVLDDVWRCLE